MQHEFKHRGVPVCVSKRSDGTYSYTALMSDVPITGRHSDPMAARREAIRRINKIKDRVDDYNRKAR